jgi:divalent metal cation (Fe/Co/Zn/Cd) transporter
MGVNDERPTPMAEPALLRRGLALEWTTLGWNLVGLVVLAVAALSARSVALAGFGLDSLIEIFASMVVVWEISGTDPQRQARALRLIGVAFVALCLYLLVQAAYVLAVTARPRSSALGMGWTGATMVVMALLAAGKQRTGRALAHSVLLTEGKVTLVDAALAAATLVGLATNAVLGWWWADPTAGLVIVFYGAREAKHLLTDSP